MKKKYKIGLSILSVAIVSVLLAKHSSVNETMFTSLSSNDPSSLALESFEVDMANNQQEFSVKGYNKAGYDKAGYNSAGYNLIGFEQSELKEKMTVESDSLTENNVKLVKEEPISTFSIDTDDGSYKLFKKYINDGLLIDKNAVRIEEFINAFDYDYQKPKSIDHPFSSEVEIIDSPWSDNKLLKIGVQGYEVNLDSIPNVNLTFLVDVSGSMESEMPRIKQALSMLVNKLRPEDSISLVTYAGNTRVVLSSAKIKDKNKILSALDNLNSGGGTNGEGGIYLAYKENEKGFVENGINRILLVSDGDFNVGTTHTDSLKSLIKEKRKSGITFSTIGISDGHYSDERMEQMANVGNGNYTFIGSISDARDVFSDRFVSTLVNVAKDVKLQVEFNPDVVKEYRLIGYENRMLKTEDFNNDKIDAGEIPSGVNATALYEITMVGEDGLFPKSRYSDDEVKTNNFNNEIGFLKIRYKKTDSKKSKLTKYPITLDVDSNSLTDSSKLAVAVAGFAQIYKDSDYISNEYSYDDVIETLDSIEANNERVNFSEIVKNTKTLKDNE